MSEPLENRFWSNVLVVENCWEWLGSRATGGYGSMSHGGQPHRAHRLSYELFRGRIPDGMTIDHLCRNRGCVNPDHLEVVTRRENILRGFGVGVLASQRTSCPNGHPLDGERVEKGGARRFCKECHRLEMRAYRIRRKQ